MQRPLNFVTNLPLILGCYSPGEEVWLHCGGGERCGAQCHGEGAPQVDLSCSASRLVLHKLTYSAPPDDF